MTEDKNYYEFIDMIIDWGMKNSINKIELIGYLTSLLALILHSSDLSSEQVEQVFMRISNNYKHFLADINGQSK